MANDLDANMQYQWTDGRNGRYYTEEGERWYECERCGFTHRESDTVIEERTGRRVCTTKADCYDPHTEEVTQDAFFFRGD